MKSLTLLLALCLLIAAPVYAQQPVTFETHPDHPGLICFFGVGGVRVGNCGGSGSTAAGRAALNFAVWGLQGECQNPTWGGPEIGGPGAVRAGVLHTESTFTAEGPMPYYIQSGQSSQYGAGHTPCTSTASGAGAYLRYEMEIVGYVATVQWRVRVDDVPADGCVHLEVTSYADGLSVPAEFEQPEAFRVGYQRADAVTMSSDGVAVTLYTPGAVRHEAFRYDYADLGKVSSVSQFCGLSAGDTVSGTTYLLFNA